MTKVRRGVPPVGVRAELPLSQSNNGGSGAFLVRADDGNRYWCKVLNNGQESPRVPVTEQIVARFAQILGVHACEPVLVEIPDALAGWHFRHDRQLEPGWAHGSRAVDPAIETRALEHRSDDNNARRQAGFFALFDWLGGQDMQWLVATGADNTYYSHDHGHYLPGGPNWTVDTLQANATNPYPLGLATEGLDAEEIERLAARLETVSEEEIRVELSKLPADWPVTDEELDAVLEFAVARRTAVAERLRAMIQH